MLKTGIGMASKMASIKARGNETKPTTNLFAPKSKHLPSSATMARSQSQPSQRDGGEPVVRRQSPRKSVTGGSAPVLSGGYLQRHSSKVRNYVCACECSFILWEICQWGHRRWTFGRGEDCWRELGYGNWRASPTAHR